MIEPCVGMTSINGSPCPCRYDEETEKITIYTGNKNIIIPDGLDMIIGQKLGMLTGGYSLFKLTVPLSNDCTTIDGTEVIQFSAADQIRFIEYVIDDYQQGSKYTEIRFQFSELDYFLPSCSIVDVTKENILFPRTKNCVCNYNIQYHNSTVSVSFNRIINSHSNTKFYAETIAEVVLNFNETDDLEYILGMYYSARMFFTFICNRQNIGLRDAILIGTYPTKTIKDKTIVDAVGYTQQRLIPTQKYLEPLEEKKKVKDTIKYGLVSSNIKELFQLFFEQTADSIVAFDGSSIHHSLKYRNLIDLEQTLHITASFEHYVRKLLPEISSKETIDFFDDMKRLIDNYIEKAVGKKKKKAKDFKKALRPQISLEDKIVKVYNGYSTWNALKPILSEWFGESVNELAYTANLWRNELAHEKREYQPDINVIRAVRLIEHMNSCIILRSAGYDDEQIKLILSEILVR